MTGILYDVLPQSDEILILLDDRIVHFHGNAAAVMKAIEDRIISIGSVVTVSD